MDHHLALFYREAEDCLEGVMGIISPGEPVVLAVPDAGPLSAWLDDLDHPYEVLDIVELGRNPARIIPAIDEIRAGHPDATLQVVSEPAWPGRSRAEMCEVSRHEALVNFAWPDAPVRWLCLYDELRLDPDTLAAAEATHPTIIRRGKPQRSAAFRPELPTDDLPPPPAEALELSFGLDQLGTVRRVVRERAIRRGLPRPRVGDLALAVDELAANAIRYGEGHGRLRVWGEPAEIVCEVEGQGEIEDPLAGRRRPARTPTGRIGLWAVNQLCDLVQLRSDAGGTVVRVHMAADQIDAGMPASAVALGSRPNASASSS
jgi:anti-sigma regulatory factor (Ser/Thr protein kinase)